MTPRLLNFHYIKNKGPCTWHDPLLMLACGLALALEGCNQEVAVEASNEVQWELLGAHCGTLADVGAATKAFFFHCLNHAYHAAVTLWLALWQSIQVSYLGRYKQHCRCVWTCC